MLHRRYTLERVLTAPGLFDSSGVAWAEVRGIVKRIQSEHGTWSAVQVVCKAARHELEIFAHNLFPDKKGHINTRNCSQCANRPLRMSALVTPTEERFRLLLEGIRQMPSAHEKPAESPAIQINIFTGTEEYNPNAAPVDVITKEGKIKVRKGQQAARDRAIKEDGCCVLTRADAKRCETAHVIAVAEKNNVVYLLRADIHRAFHAGQCDFVEDGEQIKFVYYGRDLDLKALHGSFLRLSEKKARAFADTLKSKIAARQVPTQIGSTYNSETANAA